MIKHMATRREEILRSSHRTASKLLTALNKRDIATAYNHRDSLLAIPLKALHSWVRREKDKTGDILYALAQILSRDCLYQREPTARECQLERIDNALGIHYDDSGLSRPAVAGCRLETTSRFAFYYAVSALHRRDYEAASLHFRDALRDAERLDDKDLEANAHFYLSLCDRKRGGSSESSLSHLRQSRRCLEILKAENNRVAVVDIHIAWEEFSKGDFGHSIEVAKHTIATCAADHSTVAHAQGLLARVERRRKLYEAAELLTSQAINNFKQRDRHHRALARAYANLAHTYILQAPAASSPRKLQLLDNASQALDNADFIYAQRHYDPISRPEVGNLRAMILLSSGNHTSAFDRAERVYAEAAGRRDPDYVEMSTARIIQCRSLLQRPIAFSRAESSEAEAKLNNVRHAMDCAKQSLAAIERLAGRHSRRRARAHVWLGRVLMKAPFGDPEQATLELQSAERLLPPPTDQAGYIGDELEQLRSEIETFKRNEEAKGKQPGDNTIVYRITSAELVGRKRPWIEILSDFEESLVEFLYNRGMRLDTIAEQLEGKDINKVFDRCQQKLMVSQAVKNSRKGPHPDNSAAQGTPSTTDRHDISPDKP